MESVYLTDCWLLFAIFTCANPFLSCPKPNYGGKSTITHMPTDSGILSLNSSPYGVSCQPLALLSLDKTSDIQLSVSFLILYYGSFLSVRYINYLTISEACLMTTSSSQ